VGRDIVPFRVEQFRERLTRLRIQKNVSEYEMSRDLGRNKGYIQQISSGRALPSLQGIIDICDYFGISPAEFFDVEDGDGSYKSLRNAIEGLDQEERKVILDLISLLNRDA